mmetsp:Transcript_14085/g.15917  ORF Transcript_14085/g.15917 Transcript_14085/m.15917 type:complete len:505 (+) Transcript_14085:138-1652(+)
MLSFKNVLILGTGSRFIFFLLNNFLHDTLAKFTQCNGLQSLLLDPRYSLSYFRELCHLSGIYMEGSLSIHSNNSQLSTQPTLLLAHTDKVLSTVSSMISLECILSLFTIFIEFLITVQIFRLVRNIVTTNNSADIEWEQRLEQKMNPLIHPENCWLFGLEFGKEFEDKSGISASSTEKLESDILDVIKERNSICKISELPQLCSMIYYLNPITIIASSNGIPSFQGLQYLLLISAFQHVSSIQNFKRLNINEFQPVIVSTLFLAMLTYMELYNIVFLCPLVCYLQRSKRKMTKAFIVSTFITWYFVLNIISWMFSASEHGILHGVSALGDQTNELTPNIGMFWYLFMNLFIRHRQFYDVCTKGFPFLFVVPMSLRFYRYPFALVAILHMLITLLKPIPTLPDMVLGFTLIFMSPRCLVRMGHISVIALLAMPVTIVLYVMDYWLWLESGTGNPNFVFFQCLAYNMFLTVVMLQFVSSSMERDKALRLTESGSNTVQHDNDDSNK